MQTLQAAGASAKNITEVADATREKRTYKIVDSGGVKENTGKEQAQESDDKAANPGSGDKAVTPDKETRGEELKRPVRVYFSTS